MACENCAQKDTRISDLKDIIAENQKVYEALYESNYNLRKERGKWLAKIEALEVENVLLKEKAGSLSKRAEDAEFCQCPRKPGGIFEVNDMKSMIHKVCGKPIRQEPPEGGELERWKLGYERYEKIRTLSARRFTELCDRNMKGENFDAMVDALRQMDSGEWP